MSTVAQMPGTSPANAQAERIREAFERQLETALRLRTSTAAERAARIRRLRDAVLASREALYEAADKDFRKPPAEVDLTEIMPVVAEANDAIRNVRKWMRPRRVWPTRLMIGTKAWVQYQPKGRTLIISPWNYPVNLTFGPLVSAIAAGNTAILKPSEMTPHLSAEISRITREVFAEDEVTVFEGDASVATALLDLPFDHIFFTGSPAIGRIVMAAAARHLASVTLELGGKSPTIVDATANLEQAARTVAWAKFTNAGQTCIAPDHVYVHESVREAFVEALRKVLVETYGESAEQQKRSPYLARIVNPRHAGRIASLLEDARKHGAKVLFGGHAEVEESFVQPTLLTDIPKTARIQEEEIFGPLLPIIPFTDIDTVIADINAQPKPLALYVWSRDDRLIERVLTQTSSGGACVNHAAVHFLHMHLPFGGVNNSGIGNAHGEYGFRAFSHERAVLRTRVMLARMMFPPYTPQVRSLIRLFTKFGV